MASKGKVSIIRVAVCGLTSSSYNGLTGYGAGKSCLCNRFIQSTHDKLHMDHTSVLNLSEFGSNVINNTHFLYWGEKTAALEDGQEITFQIVEHTEFVDDSSLKPFSTTKTYYKRCTQLKLQSGGKVTYIEPNQLALPEQYTDVHKFPEKFIVEGYIVCVDVSSKFDDPNDPQKEFLDHLLHNLQGTKKPVVIACTKFDRMKQASYNSVIETMTRFRKLQLQLVEVSAVKGINVDTCFLVLAHLIDNKKPKTKIISYSDSKALLDERVRRNEQALQSVLDERLTDFSMSVEDACAGLKVITEYQVLTDLSGNQRVRKLIMAKLRYLKQQLIKDRMTHFLEMLPHILTAMLPQLESNITLHMAKKMLRTSEKFKNYFIKLENWKEDTEFLKSYDLDRVPFDILDEDEGKEILEKHINEVWSIVMAKAASDKIRDVLNNTKVILPGVDMMMLWADLGLSNNAKLLSKEEQLHIYNEYMGKLEQECVADLTELFLEQSNLFGQIISSKENFDSHAVESVHKELKDMPRYKRLDHRSQLRMSQALKHIGSLHMPEKSQVYGKSGLQDYIEGLENEGLLSRERLKPPSYKPQSKGLQWVLDPRDNCFNLSILARTEENAITLRSDFMNHFSGSGTAVVGERTYQIEMSLHHGHHIHSLTSNEFVPQGAVAVVTSLKCIDWLKDIVERLWVPVGVMEKSGSLPPYRGMPLIILALDKGATPSESAQKVSTGEIHSRAQEVSGLVQCVCMTETPTTQPKRLVVSSVINQILFSIINCVSHLDEFFSSDLQSNDPGGLNIAVCTLVGDPYPNEALMIPFLKHQLVCCNKGDHTLFIKNAIEKQHRTAVISFHSMFNVTVLCSSIHLGFILVYSTQRPASLAVLDYLLPKLPNIPKVIVAMVTSNSHNKDLLEKGQELARKWDASFISNTDKELPTGFAIDFILKCWFRRFSSWSTQNLSDDVRLHLHGKKQARALPNRPSFASDGTLATPSSMVPTRHSVGGLLDSMDGSDRHPATSSSTLPRSPAKHLKAIKDINEDIYSNPVEQKRKRTSVVTGVLSPQFFSPEHTLGGSINLDKVQGLGDYASVEDALMHTEFSAGMVHSLRRQQQAPRRSPSMSPPPPPLSPPPRQELEELGEEPSDTYATVDTSQKRVMSPTGKYKGYDHLQPDDSPPMEKPYDRLDPHESEPPARPPRTDLMPRSHGSPSNGKYAPMEEVSPGRLVRDVPSPTIGDTMYATIDSYRPKKNHRLPLAQGDVYATVNKSPIRTPSPVPVPLPRTQVHPAESNNLYSIVNKPVHRRMQSDDILHQQTQPTQPGPIYSAVQKRSATPEEPMYSVPEKKKPPRVAPKPKTISPKPTGALRTSHLRSESFDNGLSSSRPGLKPIRTQSMDRRPLNAKSPHSGVRSPSPEIKTFSSLPNSYRNRAMSREQIERARSKEEIYRVKSREASPQVQVRYIAMNSKQSPSIPERRYKASDMDLDEDAPPLPPRNYSWSDIEDNDEDIWQSDDDLDEPINRTTIMEHQKIYSSIRRFSIQSSSVASIEEIYNVVNRIHIDEKPQGGDMLGNRSEWLPQVAEKDEEEQQYDTLENVVHSMKQDLATPPVTTLTAGVGGATPAAPTKSEPSVPLTPRDIKLIKQQQKLLEKLNKKIQREQEQRRRQEEKKMKRLEEEVRKREGKKRGKKGKQKIVERDRYFGSSLSSVVGEDGVPVFVQKCTEIIEESGLKIEGIYRLSGKKEDCLMLQDRFDQDPNLDIASLGLYDTCISSALKAFFKLLPEPLISNDIAAQILVINSLDADSQRTRIHEILSTMPRPNLCTLKYLMSHLYRVQLYKEKNKMNASNLAIVFWPTLMRPPLMDLADPSKQMGWQLVMTRIIEHPDFVPGE